MEISAKGDYPSQTIGAFRQMLDELEQELRSGARDAEQGRMMSRQHCNQQIETSILTDVAQISGSRRRWATTTPQHTLDLAYVLEIVAAASANTDRTNTKRD